MNVENRVLVLLFQLCQQFGRLGRVEFTAVHLL
jgi:hypothetical protein